MSLPTAARLMREGGNPVVLLPGYPFHRLIATCGRILYPGAPSGDVTRRFLEQEVKDRRAD